MQPVALGVGVGPDRGRETADPGAEVGKQPGELAAAGAERGAQLVGLGGPRELVERLDEGPVGRAHLRVAGAVEDERAVVRRLGGELAHEPALARAGLAAQQDHAAALPVGARHERAESFQLGGAADEREGRGETERTGEARHAAAADDSQI